MPSSSSLSRREFLLLGLPAAALAVSGRIPFLSEPSHALAMGRGPVVQGFHEITGSVRVNGQPVQPGDIPAPGDIVTTGPGAKAVFVLGEDAFLLRENTRLEIDAQWQSAGEKQGMLRLAAGALLSVFAKGERQLTTPTAVIGVRGTGCYMEVDPAKTYLCPCYGVFDVTAAARPDQRERLVCEHHEEPRFIYREGSISDSASSGLMTPGPMLNHTDAELIYLEKLAGRKSPFEKSTSLTDSLFKVEDDGGGGGGY